MSQDTKRPATTGKDKEAPHGAPKIGEMTGMMTGHSTRDPDTTRPGDKIEGAGSVGNLLKNQGDKP